MLCHGHAAAVQLWSMEHGHAVRKPTLQAPALVNELATAAGLLLAQIAACTEQTQVGLLHGLAPAAHSLGHNCCMFLTDGGTLAHLLPCAAGWFIWL